MRQFDHCLLLRIRFILKKAFDKIKICLLHHIKVCFKPNIDNKALLILKSKDDQKFTKRPQS